MTETRRDSLSGFLRVSKNYKLLFSGVITAGGAAALGPRF